MSAADGRRRGAAWVRVALAATAALALGAAVPVHGQAAGAASQAGTLSIGGNVHGIGGSVRTDGPVGGDFTAFGGRVDIDHAVAGDAMLAGGSVEVRAAVGDDLRAAGGDVNIAGAIGGEVYAAGGNVRLAEGGSVAGDATLAGGSITIDGKVGGKLRAAAQHIVINGEVVGDARLRAERIALGPRAKIGGVLNYRSRLPLHQAEGAIIGGGAVAAVTLDDEDDRRDGWRGAHHGRGYGWHDGMPHWFGPVGFGSVFGSAFGFVGVFAVAALFVALLPQFSARLVDAIRSSPWRSLGLGLVALVGVPLLAVLLMITLLGIPLGIAVVALYPLLLLLGFVAGVLFVGQRLRAAFRPDAAATTASTIGFAALALLLLMLVGWVPIVGALALFAVMVAGLGACLLAVVNRRQPTPA